MSDLLDLLELAATGRGSMRFLSGPDRDVVSLGSIWSRSARACAALHAQVGDGAAIAVLLEPTADCVATLLGAWRAGLTVASIQHPAHGMPGEAYTAQVDALTAAVDASVVCADPRRLASLEDVRCRVVRYDDLFGSTGTDGPGGGGFVQFTSGSTGDARGVVLSLDALAASTTAMVEALAIEAGSSLCSWLPLSHDMGFSALMTGWVAASTKLTGEFHTNLLDVDDFVRVPNTWLKACSEFRCAYTASPTFGLQLALRRLNLPATADLSSLRFVGVSAEQVVPDVLRRFAAELAPHGLNPRSLCPAYGMAEATAAVSLTSPRRMWSSRRVAADALAEGEWSECDDADGVSDELAALGPPLPDVEVRVDPATAGAVGRLQVRGPAMLTRYLDDDQPLSEDGWFTSGDLGAVVDGEVYVAGRADDIVVTRGRKFRATHLEGIVAQSDAVRAGQCAAVGDGRGGYLVYAEAKHRRGGRDLDATARSLRADLVAAIGVPPAGVIFVPAGSLPKTPSGKLRRHRLRTWQDAAPVPVDATWFGAP